MGTIFGLPLVATEQRIKAAVLGLMGIRGPAHYQRIVNELAPRIQCPLLYLLQLEDELVTRAEELQMFDAIGSKNMRLHANPGLHDEVRAWDSLRSKSTDPCTDVASRVMVPWKRPWRNGSGSAVWKT